MPFLKKSPPWQIALMLFAVAWVIALIVRFCVSTLVVANGTSEQVAVDVVAGAQHVFHGTVPRNDVRIVHFIPMSGDSYSADISKPEGQSEHREFGYLSPPFGGRSVLFIYPEDTSAAQ